MICFIHIERAGGTSLHYLLQNSYFTYLSLKPWDIWTNTKSSEFSLSNLKLLKLINPFLNGFGGHTTRSYLEYETLFDKKLFYFTFVREPISRYMSHFNYQYQVMNIKWNINDFINDERFNNFQTKRIAGESNLEKAKEQLRTKFNFVGMTEFYNESLLILKELLGNKKFKINYEKKNEIKHKQNLLLFDSFKEEQKKNIIANNEIDIELYKYVKNELFPQYQKKYTGNLQSDTINFVKSNKIFQYSKFKLILMFFYRSIHRIIIEPLIQYLSTKNM